MAEFAYNSAKSQTTGITPSEANYGMLPRQSLEPLNKTPYINRASKVLDNVWKGISQRLRENILKAQVRTARWHDLKYGKQPLLNVGDLVMVDKRNMGTRRPSEKLDYNKAGPFHITKMVGKRALCVQLLEGSQAHSTFLVPLLEPYQVSREERRRKRPPNPEPIDGEVNYVVREIVKSRKDNRRKDKPVEYFVLWEVYPYEEGTWETYDKLKGTAEETLQEFRAKNPNVD